MYQQSSNEEFKCKNRYIHFINLRYVQLKQLKNKQNNKKICDIFHHNFKNIPCYVTSEVSLKGFILLYLMMDDFGRTLKTCNCRIGFCIQTLQINLLKKIWFCFNTHLPQTPARLYSGLVFNRLKGHCWKPESIFNLKEQTSTGTRMLLDQSSWGLKPMYSFGRWWKWKLALMGFVYRVVWVIKALWIFLSETINFLRKLHKTNNFGMPPIILP